VSKATLILYTDYVLTAGTMDVYQVSGSWSEGKITYNSAPALGTKLFSAVSVTSTGYLSLDLTSTVQAWLNRTLTNNGIALVPSSGSAISVSLDSKENILTSHTAQLALVLVSAGPQGPQGVQGSPGPQGPQGTTGAQGPIGFTGATGPQGPAGPAGTNGTGFNFRSAFDNSASYAVNDVVTYSGATYVATAANQGPKNPTPDTNPAAWSVMAAQGAAGAAGAQGAAGQQGPQGPIGPIGPQGPAGAVGPAGPAGAVGPAGPAGPTGSAHAAPPCFDDTNRYVNCGNGTVTDTVTGLIWLQRDRCFGQTTYPAANQAAAGL
jgi:hypothetical protein